jgi:ribokinase
MKDVIAIGSVTRDVFLDASGLALEHFSATPSGKAFRLPLGDKLEIKNIHPTIGGNSANAAVTFAREGLKTACVGRIGGDADGAEVIKRLKSEKVATEMISVDKKLPTAFSVLLLKNGERTILNNHGSSNEFGAADVSWPALRAKWWYLSLSGKSERSYDDFVSRARRSGVAIAFNPSGYQLTNARGKILRSLKIISFLSLNEEEAALLTGISFRREREVFKKLDDLTSPGILAVTNGGKGVTVSDGKYVYRAGVFKEKRLVDRTGAGDAFGSGFVASLVRSGITLGNIHRAAPAQIKEAIRVASANATSVVEHLGATEGALTVKEANASRFSKLKIRIEKL